MWRILTFIQAHLQETVSIVGFGFVYIQIRQLNRSLQGETHSKLYDHYQKVTELLAAKPELLPYLYEEKLLDPTAPNYAKNKVEVEMLCEVISGLLEHAAVQRNNLPGDSWKHCWRAYTHERFDRSLELQNFFTKNKHWYAQSFVKIVDDHLRERGLLPSIPQKTTSTNFLRP